MRLNKEGFGEVYYVKRSLVLRRGVSYLEEASVTRNLPRLQSSHAFQHCPL